MGNLIFQDLLKGDRSMRGIGRSVETELGWGVKRVVVSTSGYLWTLGFYLAAASTYGETTGRRRTGFGDAELTVLCALRERTRGCVVFLGGDPNLSLYLLAEDVDWDDGFNTGCLRWKWGNLNCCHDWGGSTRRSRGWEDRHGFWCGFRGKRELREWDCGVLGTLEDLERVCASVVVGVRFEEGVFLRPMIQARCNFLLTFAFVAEFVIYNTRL